jgi:hypothetical protein
VGDLPAETQIVLLRVLQEHEFERIGGAQPIRVNVRIIAATNRNLKAAVRAGTFRSDLFYRLNVFPIAVPPLRERKDDIPLLVEYFIERYASKAGKRIKPIPRRTLELFQSYAWPGNVRELQNVIERAVILSEGETFSVDESWLYPDTPRLSISEGGLARLDPQQERNLIEAALAQTGGQIAGPSGAAAKLGIPRSTLETKIRKLGSRKTVSRLPRPASDWLLRLFSILVSGGPLHPDDWNRCRNPAIGGSRQYQSSHLQQVESCDLEFELQAHACQYGMRPRWCVVLVDRDVVSLRQATARRKESG